MSRIAVLCNINRTKHVFNDKSLKRLCSFGDVIINDDTGKTDAEKIKELIKDVDIAVTSWGCPTLDKEILDCAPDLRLVLHAAGSVKEYVGQEVWERGIRISNAAEALGRGVAETALGFTICALKDMWNLSRATQRSGWWNIGKERLKDVYNVIIGVVGAGNAGRHYIRLLQNFEVEVLLYDPFVTHQQAKKMGAAKVELMELAKCSDVVSVHAPSIKETYHMINKSVFDVMRDDAIFINTARGDVVDEPALIEELQKGRFFACLDVTDPEPPEEDSPLRKLPNVILTPHIAGAVTNGMYRVGKYIVDDLERYFKGEKMMGEVSFEKLSIVG